MYIYFKMNRSTRRFILFILLLHVFRASCCCQRVFNNFCCAYFSLYSGDCFDGLAGSFQFCNRFLADIRSLFFFFFLLLYFDLRPGPKMLFQGDTPEGSDTFQWPVIERDCVGGLRLMIWDKVKVPLCHYSDARKRVTSELHDSYFRLMTIKHSISKIQWAIVWALNYYIIELSWVPKQLPADVQRVRDQMW